MPTTPLDSRRYRILGVLGEGGYGRVYSARLEGSHGFTKDVAVKVLLRDDPPAEVLSRFRDEARLLGLVRDRAVVAVEPPVRLAGRWAVVMEFVPGVSLDTLLERGPVPHRVAAAIVQEVARCLRHVNEQAGPDGASLAVIHRDLKPANLRLEPTGQVKILDFGNAWGAFSARETHTTTHIGGTLGYIAPERVYGEESPAGDIFSLGVVLEEMVTGETPSQRAPDTVDIGDLATPDPRDRLVPVNPVLALAARMQTQAPSERPTAAEVEQACARLVETLAGPSLSSWAREATAAAPPLGTDDLVGTVLSASPPPTGITGYGWAVVGALAVAGLVGAGLVGAGLVGAGMTWGRSQLDPPTPNPPSAQPLAEEPRIVVAGLWTPDATSRTAVGALDAFVAQGVLALDPLEGIGVVEATGAKAPRTSSEAVALAEQSGAEGVLWGEGVAGPDGIEIAFHTTFLDGTEGIERFIVAGPLDPRAAAGHARDLVLVQTGARWLRQGDPERARALAEGVEPATVDSLALRAWAEEGLGNGDGAVRLAALASRVFAEDARSWSLLCAVHTALDQSWLGLEACERAAILAPTGATWMSLGWTRCAAARWADAEASFKEAIEADPDRGMAWTGLGWALLSQGRLDEARDVLQQALAVRDQPVVLAYAHHHLGVIAGLEGRPAAAVAELAQAHDLQPERPDFALALALAERVAGEDDAAVPRLATLREAAGIWGPIARHHLGELSASALLREANTAGDRTRARFHAGMARWIAGDLDGARHHLETVELADTTSFVEYQRARDALRQLTTGSPP